MCFNKRVVIGLGLVALGFLAVSPRSFGAVAPLLMMAACPLSMILMMRTVNREGASGAAEPVRGDESAHPAECDPAAVATVAGRSAEDGRRIRELEAEPTRLRARPGNSKERHLLN